MQFCPALMHFICSLQATVGTSDVCFEWQATVNGVGTPTLGVSMSARQHLLHLAETDLSLQFATGVVLFGSLLLHMPYVPPVNSDYA